MGSCFFTPAMEGLASFARDSLKKDVPFRDEIVQALLLASWIIPLASGHDINNLPWFLNFFTTLPYHGQKFIFGESDKAEMGFLFIVFSYVASMGVTEGLSALSNGQTLVVVVFNWIVFALFSQDTVSKFLN